MSLRSTTGNVDLYERNVLRISWIESRSCTECAYESPATSWTYVCSDSRLKFSPLDVSIAGSQPRVLVSPHATRMPDGASFVISFAAALCLSTYRSTGCQPSCHLPYISL